MFKITEETKAAAIESMREVLGKYGPTDEELENTFKNIVDIVSKQFAIKIEV